MAHLPLNQPNRGLLVTYIALPRPQVVLRPQLLARHSYNCAGSQIGASGVLPRALCPLRNRHLNNAREPSVTDQLRQQAMAYGYRLDCPMPASMINTAAPHDLASDTVR